MKPSVYLAGPITGFTFDGCTEWREHAKAVLAAEGIDGYSPMRAKDYLKKQGVLHGSYTEGLFSTARNIMTRDYRDCTNCNLILVNFLGAKAVSMGTVMEIAWGYGNRIPVVVIMEDTGNPHEHPMVEQATGFRVNNLRDGLHVAARVLLP